ncbi:MAG: hypothetical protein WCG04_03080 [Alphaproteobacteria bacterium]
MLSYKSLGLFSIVLLLSACDFQRVHQPTDNTDTQKFVIKVQGVQGYIAYKMKRDLETNLAALWRQHFTGTYLVDLDLRPERTEISYGKDATVLRAQERLKVRYTVREFGTAEPIYEGTSSLASSFNINATEEFSTMTTHKAAMDRVLTTLSEEIARDITIQIR